jgi:hypothetical protein
VWALRCLGLGCSVGPPCTMCVEGGAKGAGERHFASINYFASLNCCWRRSHFAVRSLSPCRRVAARCSRFLLRGTPCLLVGIASASEHPRCALAPRPHVEDNLAARQSGRDGATASVADARGLPRACAPCSNRTGSLYSSFASRSSPLSVPAALSVSACSLRMSTHLLGPRSASSGELVPGEPVPLLRRGAPLLHAYEGVLVGVVLFCDRFLVIWPRRSRPPVCCAWGIITTHRP